MTAGIKANVDGSAAIQVGGTDVIGLGSTGNINFPVSGQRITGDFSNATVANRVLFQTSTTNNFTLIGAIPNGTSKYTQYAAWTGSTANESVGYMAVDGGVGGAVSFGSDRAGTGTYLPMLFFTGGSEQARITTAGLFQFNSGYGSVATAYGCRAWVNFDGTSNTANLSGTYSQSGTTVTVTATAHGLIAGNVVYSDITTGTAVDGTYTVATVISSSQFTYTAGTSLTTSGNVTLRRNTIRASGNVSSIADNGTGDYTVNFATAMPDANYSTQVTGSQTGATNGVTYGVISTGPATGSVRVINGRAAGALDSDYVNVAIFR